VLQIRIISAWSCTYRLTALAGPTLQLATNNHLASSINAMSLKNRFGDVETDCRDRLHVWLLRIVGALESAHFP
jgi:hypothetical protein